MRAPDRFRRWLWVLAFAGAAGGSWWLTDRLDAPDTDAVRAKLHEPDYSMDGAAITGLDEHGRVRYTLKAQRLVHYADDGSTELIEPYVAQRIDGVWHHTRAERGWMPEDNRWIDLRGNVRAARERDPGHAGGEIRADQLRLILDRT